MTDAEQSRAIALQTLPIVAWLFGAAALLIAGLTLRQRRAGKTTGAVGRHSLAARWATLLTLTVGTLALAYAGPLPFAIFTLVVVLVGLAEIWRVLEIAGSAPLRWTGWAAGTALVVAAYWCGSAALGPAMAIASATILCAALLRRGRVRAIDCLGATLLGVCYVGLLGAFLVLLRIQSGFGGVLFFLAVITLGDVLALLGGVAVGRRPLAPSLSPGKTWEGTLIGVAGGTATAVLFRFAVPHLPLPAVVIAGGLLTVVSVAGDLVASGLKREAGVKDFGRILPGHGGVLDRFDGCLLAAPIAWLLLQQPRILGP